MLKAAVIGAGNMGRNHIRLFGEMDKVTLVAVADPDEQAARKALRHWNLPVYTDYRRMLDAEKPDLVSIVVPTKLHHTVASAAMERGIHVLVEKPLAPGVKEAKAMAEMAQRTGVKLAVGHVERFNPALRELKARLERGEIGRIFQLNARRLSPFPLRIFDVGVVLDLATHDIDAMRYLTGSSVQRVFAEVSQKAHQKCEDLLSGLIRFDSGAIGVLDINWLTPTKVRQLSVLGEGGMFLVDTIAQDLYWYKNSYADSAWETLGVFRGVSEGDMIRAQIQKKEPLRAELEDFVQCVLENRPPLVTAEDGVAVVAIAEQLLESARSNQPVRGTELLGGGAAS